jgi:hypothetical protein
MEKAQHRGQSQKSGYYKMKKSSKPLETLKTLLGAKWKTAAQEMSQKTKRLLQMQKSSNPLETLQTFLRAMVEGPKYGRIKEEGKQKKQHISSICFVSETKDNSTLTALGASLGQSSMSSGPAVVVSTTLPLVGGSNTYTDDIAAYCKEFSSFFFLFLPRCNCDEKVQQAAIRQHPRILHP